MSNEKRVHLLSGKTICQLVPRLDLGGAEQSTIDIAEAIVEAGGRAIVVSEGGSMETQLTSVGGKLIKAPIASRNPMSMRRTARWLSELIKREAIDLLHARSRAPAWVAYWARGKAQTPALVTTYHGAYAARNRAKRWYNSSMVRADHIIANSNWTAGEIRRQYTIEDAQLSVIARGTNPQLFDPQTVTPVDILALRSQWLDGTGTHARDANILFLPARFRSWKGQEVAIRALAALPASLAESTLLVMAGQSAEDAAYAGRLREIAGKVGVSNCLRLLAPVADMPIALSASDLVLSPSTRPEAFGRVAVEAGLMQRPVIVSDHGGARETVEHGVTGLRVAPGEPETLASAIGTILAMPIEQRAEMGECARAYCLELFTLDGMKHKTLSVYDKLLNNRVEGT